MSTQSEYLSVIKIEFVLWKTSLKATKTLQFSEYKILYQTKALLLQKTFVDLSNKNPS